MLEQLLSSRRLTGGDISEVLHVTTAKRELVIKTNRDRTLPGLLAAEVSGLKALAATHTIAIPEVHDFGTDETGEYLVMEYVPNRSAGRADYIRLAEQLAALHQSSVTKHVQLPNNYIGRLPQSNHVHADWPTFYAQERLLPQLRLARDKQLLTDLPTESHLLNRCDLLLGHPPLSPLHGDLWSGNYLIRTDGKPYLIDPSFHHGHAEVDLAMSRLFGGFDDIFYSTYHEILFPQPGIADRQELYQLYYLLVHLNMFGASYRPEVMRIIQKYFG